MAWPTKTGTTFLRDPGTIYKHDGFGHDRHQDIGVRTPCFREGPHSGIDLTGRGPIYSIAGGLVVASEFTKRAGHALIEDVTVPGFGRVFPIYFHAAAPMVPVKTETAPGDVLGTIGDTGTGTSPGAFHLHLGVARSLSAALSLIRNGVPVRGKRTVQQWADAAGLIDPLQLLVALQGTKAATKPPVPAKSVADVAKTYRKAMDMLIIKDAASGYVLVRTDGKKAAITDEETRLFWRIQSALPGSAELNAAEIQMVANALARCA